MSKLLGNSLQVHRFRQERRCASRRNDVYGRTSAENLERSTTLSNTTAIARSFEFLFRRPDRDRQRSVAAGRERFDFQFEDHEFALLVEKSAGSLQFNKPPIAVAMFLLWLPSVRPGEPAAKIEARVRSGSARHQWPGRLELEINQPSAAHHCRRRPNPGRHGNRLQGLEAIMAARAWILRW